MNFKYEIQEHIGTISTWDNGRYSLEVNLISYNDAPAKVDIRRWNKETNTMMKGITMTKLQAVNLGEILLGLKETDENSSPEGGGS